MNSVSSVCRPCAGVVSLSARRSTISSGVLRCARDPAAALRGVRRIRHDGTREMSACDPVKRRIPPPAAANTRGKRATPGRPPFVARGSPVPPSRLGATCGNPTPPPQAVLGAPPPRTPHGPPARVGARGQRPHREAPGGRAPCRGGRRLLQFRTADGGLVGQVLRRARGRLHHSLPRVDPGAAPDRAIAAPHQLPPPRRRRPPPSAPPPAAGRRPRRRLRGGAQVLLLEP